MDSWFPNLMHTRTSMAWEGWKSSGAGCKAWKLVCSTIWLAVFLLAAHFLDLTVPYLPLAIAGGLVFYLRNWPPVLEFAIWILLSAGLGMIVRFPKDANWINSASGVLALLGLSAFLILGLRWLWSTGSERRKTYAMLGPGAALVFFVLSAQHALGLANVLYPKTFDLYLYLVDGSLGFQPSFLMGRAMAASSILRIACLLTYVSLPFVMALVYALRFPKGTEQPSWDIVTLFLLAGLGGWALFNVVPGTGPAYVFFRAFPWRTLPYSSLHRVFLAPIPVNPNFPRNAIPSLHMAWVLLLCWNAKGLSRALRVFLGVYLALTAMSALGTGEHYFVDLVAGIPFALFVQAVVSPNTKAPAFRRAVVSVAGLALTLGWLLLVRFGARGMLVSPVLPWSLVIVTGILVWRIKLWFET
jgi:hypothetical protein